MDCFKGKKRTIVQWNFDKDLFNRLDMVNRIQIFYSTLCSINHNFSRFFFFLIKSLKFKMDKIKQVICCNWLNIKWNTKSRIKNLYFDQMHESKEEITNVLNITPHMGGLGLVFHSSLGEKYCCIIVHNLHYFT